MYLSVVYGLIIAIMSIFVNTFFEKYFYFFILQFLPWFFQHFVDICRIFLLSSVACRTPGSLLPIFIYGADPKNDSAYSHLWFSV